MIKKILILVALLSALIPSIAYGNETIKGEVTMYAYYGTTASGRATHQGTIACPKAIAFGTKIKIPLYSGNRILTCEDRMAPRYTNRNVFDIWTTSYKEAIVWGRKKEINIEIIYGINTQSTSTQIASLATLSGR